MCHTAVSCSRSGSSACRTVCRRRRPPDKQAVSRAYTHGGRPTHAIFLLSKPIDPHQPRSPGPRNAACARQNYLRPTLKRTSLFLRSASFASLASNFIIADAETNLSISTATLTCTDTEIWKGDLTRQASRGSEGDLS